MTSRRYILTIYNCTEQVNLFETFCKSPENVRMAVWQLEAGTEANHEHIQLYIVCNKPVRLSQVKTWFINNPHIEKCQGTHDECVKYCSKEETRQNGPFYYPDMATVLSHEQGKRYDISDMFAMIKAGKSELEVAEANPGAYARSIRAVQRYTQLLNAPKFRDQISVTVKYGIPGTGKSKTAWEEAMLLVDGDLSKIYAKQSGDWWDGYVNQPVVIFDDFYGGTRYSELLKVLDRYPVSVQIKGGYVSMTATTFFFTSNSHPIDWYSGIKDKVDLNALKRRITAITRYFLQDGQVHTETENHATQDWAQTTFAQATQYL